MNAFYALGLDFGTNSVRALLVDTRTGRELATSVFAYPTGDQGIVTDSRIPELARQHPADYLAGIEQSVCQVLALARETESAFDPAQVVGIGVDTTGSTPLPLDAQGNPVALDPRFCENAAAMAWLWKDHTSHAEAAEITARASETRSHYLAKCGGTYSSEWFWSKILHCARTAPEVFEAIHTWAEIADWIPAVLTGATQPDRMVRGICAAGHKGMFHHDWGGYPDAEFLGALDAGLARVRATLPDRARHIGHAVGGLTPEWAKRTGLPEGIPVAIGALDAHLGAVGSGIEPGTLVKIIGTSTCDMMIAPLDQPLPDIPGLCGIVPESILPGHFGLEAGQSAVGDIFNWFVSLVSPAELDHASLTRDAEKLRPAESGLLALDWNNGNRTVLVDPRLTGLLIGTTLYTTAAEIYRALIEATAFGARVILERFEEYGLPVRRIVNCGGIAEKNPLVMQIYADVMNRPIRISRSAQTCALGAAVAGSVVAGADRGGHADFPTAVAAMTGHKDIVFEPKPDNVAVYKELLSLYRRLHDAFGVPSPQSDLADVMKHLLALRDRARNA